MTKARPCKVDQAWITSDGQKMAKDRIFQPSAEIEVLISRTEGGVVGAEQEYRLDFFQ